MKARAVPDIFVNKSRHLRQVGLAGQVVSNSYWGVVAVLENGEKVQLGNDQFDYLTENLQNPSSLIQKDSVTN